MKHTYSEVAGSIIRPPVLPPEYIDASEVLIALGIPTGIKADLAFEAVEAIFHFLQTAFPDIGHYHTPKNKFLQYLARIFRRQETSIKLSWGFQNAVDFNAQAKENGLGFVIEINYGAVIRAASLCCEIAAIEIDGAEGSAKPSIHESWEGGNLFSVLPASPLGKERYLQLLKATILFLFSHELAHVVGGHCGYFYENKKMPDAHRKAIEADADHIGGQAAGASIIHRSTVAQQVGWPSSNTPQDNSSSLVKTCVLSSLILSVLFAELTDDKSMQYFRPALRVMIFIGGLAHYIKEVSRMPFPPVVQVPDKYLALRSTERSRQYAMDLIMKSSVHTSISKFDLQNSDTSEISSTFALRDTLKHEFMQYHPAGINEYLKNANKQRTQQ